MISFAGGTLQYANGNTSDYSARFSTAAGQIYRFDTNGQNIRFNTALTSSSGSLMKLGDGTLTLGTANTYTGTTTINGGTLAVVSGGSLGATDINVGAGGTFSVTGSGALTGNANNLTVDGTSAAPAMPCSRRSSTRTGSSSS